MPKKSKSEGSVYYNKSRNRFTVQYYENDIKTGKRKRKTKDFKTEEEGKKYLQNIMYVKISNKMGKNSIYTVKLSIFLYTHMIYVQNMRNSTNKGVYLYILKLYTI